MGSEKRGEKTKGLSRREFLKTSIGGAAGLTVGGLATTRRAWTAEKPITLALFGVCSGPAGISGEAAFQGVTLWAEDVNRRGGLLGRKVEITQKDTQNKPEEAVRFAREFVAAGTDFLIAHGSSSETFAVVEASKEFKRLVMHQSSALELTANPKVRSSYCFRVAANAVLENIVATQTAGKLSREQGITRWYTVSPDYALGRDEVNMFLEFLKKQNPKVEVVGQAWPKLMEADYTPSITAMMAAKPQAVFTPIWGGDAVNFVKQGAMYGIFDQCKFFCTAVTDFLVIEPIVKALGKFPAGLYARSRQSRFVPDSKANHDFFDSFVKRWNSRPQWWSLDSYNIALLLEAAVRKAKTTENNAVINAMNDLTVRSPSGVGPGDTIKMRARDHQLTYYSIAWGMTTAQEPYLTNVQYGAWDRIFAEESEWLKGKGWL